MKKLLFITLSVLVLAACSQPKDIYFNGAEGSGSGLKYNKDTSRFDVNTEMK
ncbi:lipoprotein [Lonepinella koalarum]|uniref:Type IV secretion system putative lipoprotein virB7 n=1 Tax=Lonepinella koalarum TaxID=53417 RepID=A0A4R1KXY4_9PAST|nr:membrane lipoprotein lipid attachment site-containing protein [Lonepinella koalarum]TCK70325.1 hypothetical protein EV692_0589 [Lonepinella koalarum]